MTRRGRGGAATLELPTGEAQEPATPPIVELSEDTAPACEHRVSVLWLDGDEGGPGWQCQECEQPFVPLVVQPLPVMPSDEGAVLTAAQDVVRINGMNSRLGGAYRTQLNEAVTRLEGALARLRDGA